MFQQHPKVKNLKFNDGLAKVDKINLIDQFLLWKHLSDNEKNIMIRNLKEIPEPITENEKSDWIQNYNNTCLASDAYLPFRDNIDRAVKSNVRYIVQPGSSIRDKEVTDAADEYGMVMAHTGIRCFLH